MGEAGSPAPSSPIRKKETLEFTSLGLRAKSRECYAYPSDLSSRSSDPLFPALASLSALALSPRLSDFPELAIPSP